MKNLFTIIAIFVSFFVIGNAYAAEDTISTDTINTEEVLNNDASQEQKDEEKSDEVNDEKGKYTSNH